MTRPAVGEDLFAALDDVLEAEAGAADPGAAGVDCEPVVEPRRPEIPDVHLRRRRLHALLAQPRVPAVEAREVLDPRDLEPDEVRRVVGDSLRVRLREADRDLSLEAEAVDGGDSKQ